MQYSDYVTSLSIMMGEQDPTNSDFVNILPMVIAYAENRLYRDLDMIGLRFIDTQTTTANNSYMTLPSQTVIVDGVTIVDALGNRYQLVPVSREFITFSYPNVIGATIPVYFAMQDQLTVVFGPWPDQVYTAEVRGVMIPSPLSSSNQTTLLTTYVPDAFFVASMVFASAYQKNFGAQSDNPQTAQSWEVQYQMLMKSAATWEMRKKFQSEVWSSRQTNPDVTAQ